MTYDTGRKEAHGMPMMPQPCKRDNLPEACLSGGMDDAFDIIDKHSASFKRRATDLAKQYAGGEVITVSEAARMLHLSNQTVRLLVKRGTLIGFAPGNRKILLFKAQVRDYLIHLQQEAIEYGAASTNKKAWYE